MKIPTITGIIRRRLLLNYRVDPEVLSSILPGNFTPQLVHGYAVAGICLIRLEEIRPKGVPAVVGISSENSAHRIAVEWETEGEMKKGVYVPRRDTDSRLNALAGGRVFPGVHHLSTFDVEDDDHCVSMRVTAKDYQHSLVEFCGRESTDIAGSIFESLDETSDFFEAGCIGYSSRPASCKLDGLKLQTDSWTVSSFRVDEIHSAFFDDESIFPKGSIEFDHALIMRDIPHEWHTEPMMEAESK